MSLPGLQYAVIIKHGLLFLHSELKKYLTSVASTNLCHAV